MHQKCSGLLCEESDPLVSLFFVTWRTIWIVTYGRKLEPNVRYGCWRMEVSSLTVPSWMWMCGTAPRTPCDHSDRRRKGIWSKPACEHHANSILLVNTHGISGWPTRKGNPTAKGQKQNWCKGKNTAEKNGKVKFTNSVEFEVKTAEAHWNDVVVDAIARLALCVTVKWIVGV